MILFWGACSGPFLIRSLSAADSGSAVRKHLSISGGDFFTTNYYLEMRENGDLIYRTTNDTTFKDFWATVVTLIDRYFPSGTD
jgi:hypothetical protein